MTHAQKPQYLKSVILEEREDSVLVTLALGEEILGDAEYFGYGIDYYGIDGSGGKRFGVRFGNGGVTAPIFEWSSATQANAGNVVQLDDGLVIIYPDASLGVDEVGSIHAFTHVNGDDVQTDQEVTVVRFRPSA